MMMYEVDLRNRKTGDSVACILSTKSHDEAWKFAKEWNKKNLPDYDEERTYDSYIDGTESFVADVYETPRHLAHGVGKYKHQ